jgi:hypothetical protein
VGEVRGYQLKVPVGKVTNRSLDDYEKAARLLGLRLVGMEWEDAEYRDPPKDEQGRSGEMAYPGPWWHFRFEANGLRETA